MRHNQLIKALVFVIPALLVLTTGCKESKNVLFCEGVDSEGREVNCGIKFETGELTAVIRSRSSFDTDKIGVEVFELENFGKPGPVKEVRVEKLTLEVKPDEKRKEVNLSFYRGGHYSVRALNGEKVFADGDIEIVDY